MNDSLRPAIYRTILRSAGFLVPVEHRDRWVEQWHSELLHVQRSFFPGRAFWESPLGFCLGAFPDAVWMMAHAERRSLPFCSLIRSPLSCIAVLATLASITTGVAFLNPQVRDEMMPPGYRGPQDLAILSAGNSESDSQLVISANQFENWTHQSPLLAAGAGFYELTVSPLKVGERRSDIVVGRASESLFQLLHFSGEYAAIKVARQKGEVPIFLNRAATQSRFPTGSVVIGTTFTIGNKPAVVLGFAPEYADDLPGEVDAWVFEDAQGMTVLASQHFPYGYMAAKLPSNFNEEQSEPLLAFSAGNGATDVVYANLLSSIARRHRSEPLLDFTHSAILACLVLPFLLSIFPCPPAVLKKLSWKDRVRHRLFLIAKVICLFPTIYCGSLLLSRINAYGPRDSAWALQGSLTFAFVIIGVHWCLRDQLRRCPRCLCSLAHPAHVGESSRCFLSWSGMELMCTDGHGLLYVPDFRTSWFFHNRWLVLDSSWRMLFLE